jgi:hypothetical protein
MICRLCLEEKNLIEAHIVARCLHKSLMSPDGVMHKVLQNPTKYPTRLPTGEYDTEILCADCDNRFSPWETYTAKLLYEDAPKACEARRYDSVYFVEDFDYGQLKLCLLSILWRMGIEAPSFFRNSTRALRKYHSRHDSCKGSGRTKRPLNCAAPTYRLHRRAIDAWNKTRAEATHCLQRRFTELHCGNKSLSATYPAPPSKPGDAIFRPPDDYIAKIRPRRTLEACVPANC